MALQSNDLFVVQSQTDSQLYKLKLSDLDAYIRRLQLVFNSVALLI